MGRKLEQVRKSVEAADELEKRGLEQGEQDNNEVTEIKSVLEGMDRELDDDLLTAVEAVGEATREEGADHMRSEVHGILDEGYEHANEAIAEGLDQAERSRQAADDFSSITGISEFGRSTAENSAEEASEMAEEFDESAETAKESMEQAEDKYQAMLDDILG